MPKFEVTTISRSFFKKVVEAADETEAGELVMSECEISGDLGDEQQHDGSIDVYDVSPVKEIEISSDKWTVLKGGDNHAN